MGDRGNQRCCTERQPRGEVIMKPSIAVLLVVIVSASMLAQQPPPQGRGERGGGGPRGAEPLVMDDHAGFQAIFDGKTLNGWDGDPAFWKVENGAIVGQSSGDNPVTENTFIIWRAGEPKDFELKVQFRMNATNSGIQIRSAYLPPGTAAGDRPVQGKWVLKGYQADIDFANSYTGQIYEERGRGFLAMRGQAVYVPDGAGAKPRVIGNLQQSADELKALIKQNDWNQVHLIARGNTIIQVLNGAVSSIVIDDDTKGRALGGRIGFQMHVGEPMKVEFREIWLKKL
jgi:3-keto-disaccharide hydrolase